MNVRQMIVTLIAVGLIVPCLVFGGGNKSKKNNNDKNSNASGKTNATWTIESIDVTPPATTAAASAGANNGVSPVVTTNSITLKSSKSDVKKFMLHVSSIDVTLDGNPAHIGDLKTGMKVIDFGVGVDPTIISKIVALSSGGDSTATSDAKKKKKK